MSILPVALLLLWHSAIFGSGKHFTANSLAAARITDAVLFLNELDPSVLDEECRGQLQTIQLGLLRSTEALQAGENNDAIGEIGVAEASLDTCLLTMRKLKSPEARRARSSLRKVGLSVSTADQLIQISNEIHTLRHPPEASPVPLNTRPKFAISQDPPHPSMSKIPTAADIFKIPPKSGSPQTNEKVVSTMPVSSTPFKTGVVEQHTPSLYSSSNSPKFTTADDTDPPTDSSHMKTSLQNGPQFSTSDSVFRPNTTVPNSAIYLSGLTPTTALRQSGEPLSSILVDFCSNHVDRKGNNVIMHLDKACALILMPEYMQITSNDHTPDAISFEFYGNQPKRLTTSYTVQGISDNNKQTFAVSFDTSLKFHKYTIKWDTEGIMWLVDDLLFRAIAKTSGKPYPEKPGGLYGLIWDASHAGLAGTIDWQNSPFTIYYTDILVSSPLLSGTWRLPPQTTIPSESIPAPMRPLVIDYCGSNVEVTDTDIEIKLDVQPKCGGRVRSVSRYLEGAFTARVKCSAGDTSGLVSSFYLSSLEGNDDADEIIFEWLGFNKHVVQTNFRVNGRAANDEVIDLNFDCSLGFHKYTIRYSKQHIQLRWVVDERLLRTVTFSQQSLLAGTPYPVKPMYVYSSVWNGSDVNNGKWAGTWHGTGLPYTVLFSDITITSSE
ncbi:hypothetical protein SELMODRAFT_411404 [Selaginella moellendorffii]|uniref:GH16 domain-containing protein n=1 Tax=Selaginella moellendorffii TaxID=88036 RepID=D8RHT7_SELML|nr:hypothetical protein SELMODRAFT_411404 [Selaginella moellendorffii]